MKTLLWIGASIIVGVVAVVSIVWWYTAPTDSIPVVSESVKNINTVDKTQKDSAASTATWKTYTNSTYGYHIQYPSDWSVSVQSTVSNGKDKEIWVVHQSSAGTVDKKIVILANVDTDGNVPLLQTSPEKAQVTIAGIPQTLYVFPTYSAVSMNHSGTWYELSANGVGAYTGVYKDILSTFGFTDTKIYTNNQYKFSLEYPDSNVSESFEPALVTLKGSNGNIIVAPLGGIGYGTMGCQFSDVQTPTTLAGRSVHWSQETCGDLVEVVITFKDPPAPWSIKTGNYQENVIVVETTPAKFEAIKSVLSTFKFIP